MELRGDITKINMQWSLHDTLNDCVANTIGWVLGILWRGRSQQRWESEPDTANSTDVPAYVKAANKR